MSARALPRYRALLYFSLSFSCSAAAQTADEPPAQAPELLDPVVVTATRQQMRADELMADATVITREQIVNSGQSTLPELIARQPGLQMDSNGGPGSVSSVFIRGAESRHTLVLIDGLRAGSATVGSPNWEAIPLSQIERIEIIRGPMSALYGSEAIGGVIQIFTRKGGGETRFDGYAGFGSHDSSEANAGLTGSSGPVRFSVRAGYAHSDGFSATTDPGKLPYSYNPDKDGFWQRNGSANLGLALGERHDLSFSWLGTNGRAHYDNGETGFDDYMESSTDQFGLTLVSQLTNGWKSTLRLGQSIDKATTYESYGSTYIKTTQDQFTWQNDIKLPLGQALLAYEYLKQKVDATTAYNVDHRDINSLLAGWNAAFGPRDAHRVQVNVRYDDNSQFGDKTTGLFSYGYQFDDYWRAHATYGTAFNAPSFNMLYWPDTGFGGGNPDLKPERARNAELGLTRESATQRASLVIFENRIKDMINGWPPENTSRAKIKGASLSWNGNWVNWNLSAHYDWMEPRDEDTGARLARRADNQGGLSAGYLSGPWNFGAEWQFVGKRFDDAANEKPMGGYALTNLFAHYALTRDLRLEARVNNVFDKDYETSWGYSTPGCNFFIGIRYTPG